ncbi:MAG: hypothetical protein JWM95_1733 [Gemmatimonadetes bacterium]|nr:hypothetical protein [Gemmatimonadota bacterium]
MTPAEHVAYERTKRAARSEAVMLDAKRALNTLLAIDHGKTRGGRRKMKRLSASRRAPGPIRILHEPRS